MASRLFTAKIAGVYFRWDFCECVVIPCSGPRAPARSHGALRRTPSLRNSFLIEPARRGRGVEWRSLRHVPRMGAVPGLTREGGAHAAAPLLPPDGISPGAATLARRREPPKLTL